MYYPKMTRTEFGHIVLRVPTPFFENLPEWLTTNFTIIEGGKYNGQASRNKLIVFSDGTYLELFNWYDTPPSLDDKTKPMRVWGPKQDGLIDFALTSTTIPAEECMGAVNDTLSKGTDGDAALDISRPEGLARAKVIVRAARSEYDLERKKTRGIGFSDLIIETSEDIDGGKRSFGSFGIESTLWLGTSALKKARL